MRRRGVWELTGACRFEVSEARPVGDQEDGGSNPPARPTLSESATLTTGQSEERQGLNQEIGEPKSAAAGESPASSLAPKSSRALHSLGRAFGYGPSVRPCAQKVGGAPAYQAAVLRLESATRV